MNTPIQPWRPNVGDKVWRPMCTGDQYDDDPLVGRVLEIIEHDDDGPQVRIRWTSGNERIEYIEDIKPIPPGAK